ncbi:hypothetical protein H4R20_001248 [Coemansia guatemalensis]|uniref:P-loop containing nucleoside triphosphate hydrolase protein n=1 Tax=Coemansia guatemalensis TaxID=2761395 RepID=A0A9W8HXR6_9FUNG|nr:hypothetical protein H4R20_001248 [Coemansia guatemalensis]
MPESSKLLRILHFNDVYNVGATNRDPIGGASRFTTLVHSLQDAKGAAPTLTLFSGDAYFPSLESTISRGEHMLQVLNRLNIDASVLGNHEFDMGVEQLESLMSRNNFPWLLTNLTDSATGNPAAKGSLKYLIKEVDGVRIGIIGIIEKEWLDTLTCLLPTFQFQDYVTSARETATMLRNPSDASMACDIVICLSHMRLGNDVKLIEQCGDVVDLILSGHDHFYYIGSGIDSFEDPSLEILPDKYSGYDEDIRMLSKWKSARSKLGPNNLGKRIINSGTDFRDLSEIILDLDKSIPGKTQIRHVSVTRHRTTSNIPETPDIKELVDEMEARLSKALGYVIGHSSIALDARASTCRIGESSLGSLAVDLMRLYYAQSMGAQIGIMCGGAIRSDRVHPAGEIRMRDIMEIFPFDDPVVVLKLTGEQILCALENGVSKWPEHDGRFPQVSGIRFEFDPRKAPGDRITSVVVTAAAKAASKKRTSERVTEDSYLDAEIMSDYGDEEDELLDMNAHYIVAVRDYMYQGHDGYEVLSDAKAVIDKDSGILISSLFKRYLDGLAACNAGRRKRHVRTRNFSPTRRRSRPSKQNFTELKDVSAHELAVLPMAYLCPSGEGWGPLSPTYPTHLTICFQYGALVFGLNILFLLAAAVRLRKHRGMPRLPSALVSCSLLWAKLFFATVALLASAAELKAVTEKSPYVCVYTISLALQAATTAFAIYLHYMEQFHNRIASTPLLLFWLGTIIISLTRLRTLVLLYSDKVFYLQTVSVALFTAAALVVFALECQSKPRELFEQTDNDNDDSGFGKPEDSDSDYCTSGSPEERANVFSQYTYTWVGSLLKKGYHKQLQLEDVWKLNGQYRPDIVNARFQHNWQKELRCDKPSLFRATIRTYWKFWALTAMHEVLRITVTFARIIIMSRLIGFAATYGTVEGDPIEYGYFYAVILFILTSEQNVAYRLRWTHAQSVKTLVRTSYMTAIYQKLLALSNDARQKYDSGSIVTHMSIDSENVTTFFEQTSQDLWYDSVYIIISLSMLYSLLGWSAFAGVAVMLVCTPIMSHIGQIIGARSKLLMSYRDQRMGIMNEVITGIRVVKMYAWELPFIKRINNVRVKLELGIIGKNNVLSAILHSATTLVPFMVSFVTFGTYGLFDNVSRGPLNAQLVFVGIPLLTQVRVSLVRVPRTIPGIRQAIASSRRITDFLTSSEIDFAAIDRQPYDRNSSDSTTNDLLINIKGGSFKWSSADQPAIRDIDIQCRRSELLAVIGRVASGKSSLVSAILGDMIKCSGSATVCGSIAYVAQQPWILNATLRDNILFGSDYDPEFYNRVIDACALRQDVDALSAGDMSEIGERGINLSGGQKMRVSLARAVYARADVYILDDPLAAVDAHVSKHIFTHVLGPRGILRSRARILVTNAVQYLNSVDNIVMLCDGRIIEQGSTAQAMEKQGDIFEFIHQHIDSQGSTESSSTTLDSMDICDDIDNIESHGTSSLQLPVQRNVHASATEPTEQPSNNGRTTTTEFRRDGEVEWKTYRAYIAASGKRNVLIAAIAFFAAVFGEACTSLWLRHWTSSNTRTVSGYASVEPHSSLYFILGYGAIGLIGAMTKLLMLFFIWSKCALRASTKVHQNMLTGVLRSPMSFFDTTPTGRILNRFSSDMQKCDETLPNNMSLLLDVLSNLLIAFVLVGISTPLILVILPLLAIISYHYQGLYIKSSREIRRLDSTTRSPIFAHFQESSEGVSTIRAYGQQSRFISEMEYRLGQHIRVDNTYLLLNQWLAMRLETVGATVTLGTALLALASMHYSGSGDANIIGLAIGSTFIINGGMNWGVRYYSDMQISMTHLERAAEYADLTSEAADVIDDHRPKEAWPEQGVVEFKNYSTRYREGLDLVLKDLSFRVLPRQKAGIVGRTGAGKSSLTLALFRIIEAASGQILLDGEDILQYGLFDVRSKLSIIPQDPVLFAGTVRENLDPFGSYNDQDIWRALEQAHLADYIRSKDERLEFMVTQSGGNFSVGQRQLICLARALLKHAKVLILDEATAAIDNETDAIIQQTIRSEFKDCTVLTIAHRLDTVIDSDMVLVIDGGRLAEYDTPQNLLANNDSIFTKLVKEAQSVSN